jgi:hypothetical protein
VEERLLIGRGRLETSGYQMMYEWTECKDGTVLTGENRSFRREKCGTVSIVSVWSIMRMNLGFEGETPKILYVTTTNICKIKFEFIDERIIFRL